MGNLHQGGRLPPSGGSAPHHSATQPRLEASSERGSLWVSPKERAPGGALFSSIAHRPELSFQPFARVGNLFGLVAGRPLPVGLHFGIGAHILDDAPSGAEAVENELGRGAPSLGYELP